MVDDSAAGSYNARMPIVNMAAIPLPVLGFSLWCYRGLDTAPADQRKQRPYFMLAWVEKGELTACSNDALHVVRSGEAILLPSGAVTGFLGGQACERYQMKFGGAAVEVVLDGLGLAVGVPVPAGTPPPASFLRLHQALQDVTDQGALSASHCTYEILARLAMQGRATTASPLVAQALGHIERAWSDPALDVQGLARVLGVHRALLSERFREEVGLPPSAYLRAVRLRQALSLLEETAVPIAEVARRCALGGKTQFSRFIRRETGRSPREIRRGV